MSRLTARAEFYLSEGLTIYR
ncbi:hypothetical protein DFAR_2220001 [Desulfarculales bacterium]